jgi:hypothetical protein
VTKPPQKWGVRLPGSGSGDSWRSENAYKHTYEAFKIIISLKLSYSTLVYRLQQWEAKGASKDRTCLCKHLTRRSRAPVWNPALRSLDFHWKPSSALPERREGELAHKKLQSKAWATTPSKTDPSWPSGQTSRHAKASSGKGSLSLHQLTLNIFKHVISQV